MCDYCKILWEQTFFHRTERKLFAISSDYERADIVSLSLSREDIVVDFGF